ncbi:MAG: CDP-diacylglycerol--serine O-phosphatidyltransferase [Microscillaceae bacterium]|nr:CDP-diacylglycerol--serine O-phosphatidyltransferase [Microscillaceae bacterium]
MLRRNLPNLLTLGNLLCGCVGLWSGSIFLGAICILLGMIFDFLDGAAARALHVQSEMGKALDSLADLVTFGVLPGKILWQAFGVEGQSEMAYLALLYPAAVAWRLARYNVRDSQQAHFIGLPSPAGAAVVACLLLGFGEARQTASFVYGLFLFSGLALPLLMLSQIPLLSFKIKDSNGKSPKVLYLLGFGSLVLGITLQFKAGPLILALYLLISFWAGKNQYVQLSKRPPSQHTSPPASE